MYYSMFYQHPSSLGAFAQAANHPAAGRFVADPQEQPEPGPVEACDMKKPTKSIDIATDLSNTDEIYINTYEIY